MAPRARCKAKVSRREILFKEFAQCGSDLSKMNVYFKRGSCDEGFGEP